MATRLYFPSSGSAEVTPSSWLFPNQITNPVTYATRTSRINSSFTNVQGVAGSTAAGTMRAMGRWVLGPIGSQTISGTVKGQMRCSESNMNANATLGIGIKIIKPDGTDRATLLSPSASDSTATPPEMSSFGLLNRKFMDASENASISLTSQSATSGDYIVIEVGMRTSAADANYTITWRIGDNNSTELAEDETTNSDHTPWIEFSHNINFTLSPPERSFGYIIY